MKRTWTKAAKEYNDTEKQRCHLAKAFNSLTWQSIKGGLDMPALPGLGIKAAIKELRLPKVSHVADSAALAPYGLYGIRANYKDGRADVYLMDLGTRMVVLASDFWPTKEAQKAIA